MASNAPAAASSPWRLQGPRGSSNSVIKPKWDIAQELRRHSRPPRLPANGSWTVSVAQRPSGTRLNPGLNPQRVRTVLVGSLVTFHHAEVDNEPDEPNYRDQR